MDADTEMKLEKYKIALDFLKFEATTLWQIYSAFLVAHTILLGFITASFAGIKSGEVNFIILLIAGVIGLLLAILWTGTTHRNSEWYYIRMKQAKEAEETLVGNKDKWHLLTKGAAKFNKGIRNRTASYGMCIIFILIYLGIISFSFIKISWVR